MRGQHKRGSFEGSRRISSFGRRYIVPRRPRLSMMDRLTLNTRRVMRQNASHVRSLVTDAQRSTNDRIDDGAERSTVHIMPVHMKRRHASVNLASLCVRLHPRAQSRIVSTSQQQLRKLDGKQWAYRQKHRYTVRPNQPVHTHNRDSNVLPRRFIARRC